MYLDGGNSVIFIKNVNCHVIDFTIRIHLFDETNRQFLRAPEVDFPAQFFSLKQKVQIYWYQIFFKNWFNEKNRIYLLPHPAARFFSSNDTVQLF